MDYDPNLPVTQAFFATVQNKFHFAIHGHTAAELIAERAKAGAANMGLQTWKGAKPRKADALVAKNYLGPEEIDQLNLIVEQYLSFAELQARSRKPMAMRDWTEKLHGFLKLNDREVLHDAGRISHDLAEEVAAAEYEIFDEQRRASSLNDSEFDRQMKRIEAWASSMPQRSTRADLTCFYGTALRPRKGPG